MMPASFAYLMFTFIGLPLLVILVNNVAGKKIAEKWCLVSGCVVTAVQMISAAVAIGLLCQYKNYSITFSQFWDISLNDDAAFFSADIFSLVVLFAIGLVGFSAFFTSRTLIKDKTFSFSNLCLILILGMNGMALVSDLFSLYVFMEITGIASFVLIALHKNNKGLEGGFKYLVLSAVASAFILLGLALLFLNAKSLSFVAVAEMLGNWVDVQNPTLVLISFIFLITGFAIKSGLVPFHGWLPDAYQSAPAPVSVLLGGIVTKMAGVYAIIRLLGGIIISQPVVNTCLMVFAILSIVYGAVAAMGQKDFKRILAYSSISQIGYIILGVTCGSILGYLGAIMHFFNHATFKTTLFLNSAAIEQQAGTTNIEDLGGLQKQMPITSISSILAFLSTAGIPPLAGFWSKLLIIIAVWQAFGVGLAAVALLASILTAAYFLRLQRNVFFGPFKDKLSEVQEATGGFRFTQIFLSAITVLFGLLFPMLLLILQNHGMI